MTIRRILVANRGEIARRVFRTCQALGIETVAVYSDADAQAAHVRQADTAIRLGPAEAAASYLNVEAILGAARRSGADAIHPGYGFLSESADFARAVQQAGLTWIGPPPAAMEAMALKREARQLAASVGVAVVPGHDGPLDDPATAQLAARELGYPLLVKASAGGGGRGMRIVRSAEGLEEALASARREAAAAFGDETLLLERYVELPRHVEIQIFADAHGQVVHLFERECSIQRRHQKVVEEAPAPGLSDTLREAMGEAACRLARAIGYMSAGTVEFILAPDGAFYFLEMNTRLQVEHPVTEAITGLDLVALQIAVAEGAPLPFEQEGLRREGAAIECRLYAEDPTAGYLPSPGLLEAWLGQDQPGVRVDSGFEVGDRIPVEYDAMVAKIIVQGADRAGARRKMVHALQRMAVLGFSTNRELLLRLLEHPSFIDAALDTQWLDRLGAELLAAPEPMGALLSRCVALTLWLHEKDRDERELLPALRPGFRNVLQEPEPLRLTIAAREVEVQAVADSTGAYAVAITGFGDGVERAQVTPCCPVFGAEGEIALEHGGVRRSYQIAQRGRRALVMGVGGASEIRIRDRFEAAQGAGAQGSCQAPMPGRVLQLHVGPGAPVQEGAPLVTLEAMKMEHVVRAPHAGTVAALHVELGSQVSAGEELVTLSPAAPAV